MKKFYIDEFISYKEIFVDPKEDLLTAVLNEKNIDDYDCDRFYLEYLPQDFLNDFDFSNAESLKQFRKSYYALNNPLNSMCACNLSNLSNDIRYNGLKISDPNGEIYGSFDIRNNIITYSPIFPHIYEERDLIKMANTTYFTGMTFEEIMKEQINKYSNFYVHTGNYITVKDIAQNGHYILEKINENQMLAFVKDPNEGAKVFLKHINYN
ncbi:MAG: hypothetical protein PHQ89_02255 [Bacilli bacterium]|nr:hypothetical protein [Bacilli bacterium]